MLSYGFKDVAVLMSGFLLLTQGAALPQTLPGTTGVLTCPASYSASYSPSIADCKAALAKISPGAPGNCLAVITNEYDAATVGTCTIHTYSYKGKAHCLNGSTIINGVNKILAGCASGASTGGQYQWTTLNVEQGEGVRLQMGKGIVV